MSNEDAILIQSAVTSLREKRGEEVIGYKIGCVSKKTQKEMGFTKPAWGRLWNNEIHKSTLEVVQVPVKFLILFKFQEGVSFIG